jgi:hypothetical protein
MSGLGRDGKKELAVRVLTSRGAPVEPPVRQRTITWPVVNVRQIPGTSPTIRQGRRWAKDPYLDTQLLVAEPVQCLDQRGDWAYIAVPSQPRYRQGWVPYTGWVPTAALGQRPVSPALLCTQPFDWESFGRQWEDTPYLWGGTSPYSPEEQDTPTGIDCSGLVWLGFRAQGQIVPRDAHDQWLLARPVPRAADLQPGDLVFLSDQEPHSRIHHVMVFLREDTLLEAAGSTGFVHLSSLRARCRCHLDTASGSWTGQFRIWFGRLKSQRFPDSAHTAGRRPLKLFNL